MKKKISMVLLSLVTVLSISTPAMAYISPETGRHIEYFDYKAKVESSITTFSDVEAEKQYRDRQWAVTLEDNGGAVFNTCHALFRYATCADQAGVEVWIQGTGSGSGDFYDDWGFENFPWYVIGSRCNTRETEARVLKGQFSPDAP